MVEINRELREKMEQQFTIDKKVQHVKAYIDAYKELYVFRCFNCKKNDEYHFNYFRIKSNKTMKEIGEAFVFQHKNCKETI